MGGPFSTFIFYFLLAPENSVRIEEKKNPRKTPTTYSNIYGSLPEIKMILL